MNIDLQKIRVILLAAGYGTRLKPLTDIFPKCLMPVGNAPLLEHWLTSLKNSGLFNVIVNTHYKANIVTEFLKRKQFKDWVINSFEENLLGTAGTVRAHKNFVGNNILMLVHADNWTHCNLMEFIEFHYNYRNKKCPITMMTFDSDKPQDCGIVEVDAEGVVVKFHEKKANPPGKKANAAIYLIEPEVIDWLVENPDKNDFSTEVLPYFMGKIATWHNPKIHRDIGTIDALVQAQSDSMPVGCYVKDEWIDNYNKLDLIGKIRR